MHFAVMLFVVTVILIFSCNQTQEKDETILPANNVVEPATAKQNKPAHSALRADKNLLVGNWVRTDADYQLKISEVLDNGNLSA